MPSVDRGYVAGMSETFRASALRGFRLVLGAALLSLGWPTASVAAVELGPASSTSPAVTTCCWPWPFATAPRIAQMNETVQQLKDGLTVVKTKLEDLKSRRSQLVARARARSAEAQAQAQVQESMASIDVLYPSSDLARFEQRPGVSLAPAQPLMTR